MIKSGLLPVMSYGGMVQITEWCQEYRQQVIANTPQGTKMRVFVNLLVALMIIILVKVEVI